MCTLAAVLVLDLEALPMLATLTPWDRKTGRSGYAESKLVRLHLHIIILPIRSCSRAFDIACMYLWSSIVDGKWVMEALSQQKVG